MSNERYTFLSPEWIEKARALREAARAEEPAPAVELRMNLHVADVPTAPGGLEAHLDTSGGIIDVDLGALERPDVVVRLDYSTAYAILVEGNGDAAMQAFLAGKIQVEGDLSKLLAFQASPVDAEKGVGAQIRAMTA
jgi:hypothetical protein